MSARVASAADGAAVDAANAAGATVASAGHFGSPRWHSHFQARASDRSRLSARPARPARLLQPERERARRGRKQEVDAVYDGSRSTVWRMVSASNGVTAIALKGPPPSDRHPPSGRAASRGGAWLESAGRGGPGGRLPSV